MPVYIANNVPMTCLCIACGYDMPVCIACNVAMTCLCIEPMTWVGLALRDASLRVFTQIV